MVVERSAGLRSTRRISSHLHVFCVPGPVRCGLSSTLSDPIRTVAARSHISCRLRVGGLVLLCRGLPSIFATDLVPQETPDSRAEERAFHGRRRSQWRPDLPASSVGRA